jgi:uncharacterized protein YcaQ
MKQPQILTTTAESCRRFLRASLMLDAQFRNVPEAVQHLGYVQIDPIDVCGRMHDLILRNRVQAYPREGLLNALYNSKKRVLFEHYLGVLVALPVEDYRYVLPTMKARRQSTGTRSALDPEQKTMAKQILDRIRAEGPLSSSNFLQSGSSRTDWGTNGSLAKTTLDKLFLQGRLLISRRDQFRRVFDLPERILPESVLSAKPATLVEMQRWHILSRLRQRRLISLTKAHATLVPDLLCQIQVDSHAPLYCLRSDAPLLDSAADAPSQSARVHLLAPLDPLIYDRKLTRSLWGYDYTWEVYTPPAKRLRGYYALPILSGTRIVGYADPKLDRSTSTLHVRVEVEPGIDYHKPIEDLAVFLSAEKVNVSHHEL